MGWHDMDIPFPSPLGEFNRILGGESLTVIICTDERGGMLFNKRRVSRDEFVTLDIINTVASSKLYIKPYSEKLFREYGGYELCDDPLSACGEGDYCFIEDEDISPFLGRADGLIIYNWCRAYPYDLKFDTPPAEFGFVRVDSKKFAGHSHKKIVKDVYRKNDTDN